MAEQNDSLMIEILRQIQGTLAEHSRRFEQIDRRFEQMQARMDERFEQVDGRFEQVDSRFERMQRQIDHRFDRVDRELTELLDSTIRASGEASVSMVRHESVQRQFAEMELALRAVRERLQRLEEKV